MKRLALVLAATVLGSGCIVTNDTGGSSSCVPAVTLDWSGGFLMVDGVRRACSAAGVTWVDLYINGDASTAARLSCAQGAAQAASVPSGTNLYTVEGIESSGRIAYRAEVSVTSTCGDQQIAVTPAEGTLALDYAFAPTNTCYATQPTYIWSEVRDAIANQVAFVDHDSSSPLCSTTAAAPTFLLPAGSFTLVGVNEWSPSVGIVGADCTQATFTIAGGATTTVTPTLVDSARACF